MIKVFLFEFILIILPRKVLNGYSIELKVWKTGYQQILSNKYSGQKPSAIYINKEVQILGTALVHDHKTNDFDKDTKNAKFKLCSAKNDPLAFCKFLEELCIECINNNDKENIESKSSVKLNKKKTKNKKEKCNC